MTDCIGNEHFLKVALQNLFVCCFFFFQNNYILFEYCSLAFFSFCVVMILEYKYGLLRVRIFLRYTLKAQTFFLVRQRKCC